MSESGRNMNTLIFAIIIPRLQSSNMQGPGFKGWALREQVVLSGPLMCQGPLDCPGP